MAGGICCGSVSNVSIQCVLTDHRVHSDKDSEIFYIPFYYCKFFGVQAEKCQGSPPSHGGCRREQELSFFVMGWE